MSTDVAHAVPTAAESAPPRFPVLNHPSVHVTPRLVCLHFSKNSSRRINKDHPPGALTRTPRAGGDETRRAPTRSAWTPR